MSFFGGHIELSFFNNMNEYIQKELFSFESVDSDSSKKTGSDSESKKDFDKGLIREMHSTFRLPITYLPIEKIHSLSGTVSTDLEMDSGSNNLYDILFKPSNPFAKSMVDHEWNQYFTTDKEFLTDSQMIIGQMDKYKESTNGITINSEKMVEIWKSCKKDAYFYDRYSYVEWSILKEVNRSPLFLQSMSMANMASPILSFVMPIFCLILPFFILQIQGIPITISVYFETLKQIARSHFVGKSILSLANDTNWNTILYFIFTVLLYIYQVYQNIVSCQKFYTNLSKINDYLFTLKNYVKHTGICYQSFKQMHSDKSTYVPFCENMDEMMKINDQIGELLEPITEFKPSIWKITEVGYMMRCFYELHENEDFEKALKWSFGFHAFIDNLYGVFENLSSGTVHMAKYIDSEQEEDEDEDDEEKEKDSETFIQDEEKEDFIEDNEDDPNDDEKKEKMIKRNRTAIYQQFYPPHLKYDSFERNDCVLDKNMIITGPNASGKTTFLKTTMINLILSQQIGGGFYESANIRPYEYFHSYLNIPDTSGRDSLFQAESRRCKEILDIIAANPDEKHFCIFDELYSGTNPKEAASSAYSFLSYLSAGKSADFMLTTHYVSICDKLEESGTMKNCRMMAEFIDDEKRQIRYLYRIEPGVSTIEGAITVLENMNYPDEIIRKIREIS